MSRNIKHRDPAPVERNASQWRAISYFLAGIEVLARGDAAAGRRSAADAAPGAGLQALPDGNHGDNRRLIK
ncbi:hypothetical protein [Comamonas endophytica]|uniref:Uncharacterized protein n=1 Tax=Comamonas endophytica TaxID=2949090 RepID=A0ABY6G8D1_9BURK|nr:MULTISPECIES: hypothetical protein [unclassified Acidovorax]MCD2514564.1 hypothetical protein [Acidovorax sp. D4N7]UYG51141.1 hypothetical protein M9799_13745 [Acidovorax sp. 5MLIR]